MVLSRLCREVVASTSFGEARASHCFLPRVQKMPGLSALLEEVRLPDVEMRPYWLSWPVYSAIIKHYNLGGSYETVYPHSTGGGVKPRDQ